MRDIRVARSAVFFLFIYIVYGVAFFACHAFFLVYTLDIEGLRRLVALLTRRLSQLFLVRKFSHVSMAICTGNRTVHIGLVVLVTLETILILHRSHRRRRKNEKTKNEIYPTHWKSTGQ